MREEKYKAREVQPTVLRLHPDLRGELMRIALANGRSLSKEAALRLQASLIPVPPGIAPGAPVARSVDAPPPYLPVSQSSSSGIPLSVTDRALLELFHRLTLEKQSALLELLR